MVLENVAGCLMISVTGCLSITAIFVFRDKGFFVAGAYNGLSETVDGCCSGAGN